MQRVGEDVPVVEVARGASLKELDEGGEGGDGREADEHVHVVGGAARSDQDAVERLGAPSEQASEPIINRAEEYLATSLGGPDDVNENVGRRAAWHALSSAGEARSCLSDARNAPRHGNQRTGQVV